MPKKILFFDHTAHLGGGEIALLNLVQGLDLQRFIPIVVLGEAGPLEEELRKAGIEVHVLPIDPSIAGTRKDTLTVGSLRRLKTIAHSCLYTLRLAWFMKNLRPHIVHTNSLKADILGGIAARLAGLPLIWHIRDRIDEDYLPAPAVRALRFLTRLLPDYVLANSGATLNTLQLPRHDNAAVVYSSSANATAEGNSRLRSSNGSPSRVIHDGVVTGDTRVTIPRSMGKTIGLVGRISPWKGQHIFIQAAAAVREQFPNVKFQIIGSALFGEEAYEAEVRALADDLALDNCLEFMGFRKDVPDLMRNLDVLVHASTTGEPFGQVVVEGMLAGKPVVATNGGGVPEIVVDGVTGLLVPMNDVNSMVTAINYLLSNDSLAHAMGQTGRRLVLERFTIEQTSHKVQTVYDDLLKRKHRRHLNFSLLDAMLVLGVLMALLLGDLLADELPVRELLAGELLAVGL